jgi:Holliday junction DNA helicase RuvA
MIGYLDGNIISRSDSAVILNVGGVGYEVFCASRSLDLLSEINTRAQLFIHTQYKSDGAAALFGFLTQSEKNLFLELIKVDSVGPKSALNILSAAPWQDIAHLIEDGDVASLSRLPKISKKTAEHLVVKLKGKLEFLILESGEGTTNLSESGGSEARTKIAGVRKLRAEAQTALSHLGYKSGEIERALEEIDEETWKSDLQQIIRAALSDLSGNIL